MVSPLLPFAPAFASAHYRRLYGGAWRGGQVALVTQPILRASQL
jgi:hypothetical protein